MKYTLFNRDTHEILLANVEDETCINYFKVHDGNFIVAPYGVDIESVPERVVINYFTVRNHFFVTREACGITKFYFDETGELKIFNRCSINLIQKFSYVDHRGKRHPNDTIIGESIELLLIDNKLYNSNEVITDIARKLDRYSDYYDCAEDTREDYGYSSISVTLTFKYENQYIMRLNRPRKCSWVPVIAKKELRSSAEEIFTKIINKFNWVVME